MTSQATGRNPTKAEEKSPYGDAVMDHCVDQVAEHVYSQSVLVCEPISALVGLAQVVRQSHIGELSELKEEVSTPALKGNMRAIFNACAQLDPTAAFKAPTPLMAPSSQRLSSETEARRIRDKEQLRRESERSRVAQFRP